MREKAWMKMREGGHVEEGRRRIEEREELQERSEEGKKGRCM